MRELKTAALDEVRERGAVDLSLRAVARRMGMSPAGLYRYVGSREELLTLLITDAYEDLGRHVQAAIGLAAHGEQAEGPRSQEPPLLAGPDAAVADRLRAVAHAYRSWSVSHPNEFGLLFGDPIPGYAAPPDGPTVQAMTGFAIGLAAPLLEAWHAGLIHDLPQVPPTMAEQLLPLSEVAGDVPPGVSALLLLAWGRLHGQISLEVFGHHRWAFPEGCESLFDADLELLLRHLGVTTDPADATEGRA